MPSTLTTRGFLSCNQIRLDINPASVSDVIDIMTDMAAVATASVQAVFFFPHHRAPGQQACPL
jgi:hypothetical protein